MALTAIIRDQVLTYLAGDSTLAEFEEWLVENTWDAHLSDLPAADLAYTLKHLLAEYTSGHRSEVDLRLAFVPLGRDPGRSPHASSSPAGDYEHWMRPS